MNIAAIGSPERLEELNGILSSAGLSFTRLESTKNLIKGTYDCLFDLNFDDNPDSIQDYMVLGDETLLFLSGVKIQIEASIPATMWSNVIFVNAWPGFLKRNALEYSTLIPEFNPQTIVQLGWNSANRVMSRVGMVSPRVVCMIINEAFYTLQEGTAGKEDINNGMKLGTAYPYGPFEWCEIIGIKQVFETLSALFEDTRDERYRICSMLKTDYLRNKSE